MVDTSSSALAGIQAILLAWFVASAMAARWLLERLEKGVRASVSGCASMAVQLRSEDDELNVTA
jgi:hypothetical protein